MVITPSESATSLLRSVLPRVLSSSTWQQGWLILRVYKRAVRSFAKYLDAPAEVRAAGFFEVLRYWLVRTEHLVHEDWIPYPQFHCLLGNYGTDLA